MGPESTTTHSLRVSLLEGIAVTWRVPLRFHPINVPPGLGGEAAATWYDGSPGEVSYVPYWSQYIYFSLAVKCRHEGLCWVQWAADVSNAWCSDR